MSAPYGFLYATNGIGSILRVRHFVHKAARIGARIGATVWTGVSPVLTVNVANYVEQNQFDRSQVCSALRFVGPYRQRSEQRRAGSRHIKEVIIT